MKNKKYDELIENLQLQIDEMRDDRDMYKSKTIKLEQENMRLKKELENLKPINDLLTQGMCDKFVRGTAILYDEHYPRVIKVFKDGNSKVSENMTSIYFHWDAGEFPTLEITEV